LIHTFKKIASKNDKVHFAIIGPGVEEQNLKELVSSLNMSDRIHFLGRVETKDMPYAYADAALFTFASTSETQGVVVLEAVAAGLPTVVVDDLAFKDIVINGKNGFRLPLKENEFAKKIIELLENPDLRKKFSESSPKIASKYSNGQALTKELVEYYKDVVAEYKKKGRIFKRIANKLALVKLVNATGRVNKFLTRT